MPQLDQLFLSIEKIMKAAIVHSVLFFPTLVSGLMVVKINTLRSVCYWFFFFLLVFSRYRYLVVVFKMHFCFGFVLVLYLVSICSHLFSLGFLFMDDLSRAVEQFYHSVSSGSSTPTPPLPSGDFSIPFTQEPKNDEHTADFSTFSDDGWIEAEYGSSASSIKELAPTSCFPSTPSTLFPSQDQLLNELQTMFKEVKEEDEKICLSSSRLWLKKAGFRDLSGSERLRILCICKELQRGWKTKGIQDFLAEFLKRIGQETSRK